MSARSARLKNNPGPRARRSRRSLRARTSPPSSDLASKSTADIAVDTDLAEFGAAVQALAAQPSELNRFLEPDLLKSLLATGASVTGEHWDKMLDAIGPAGRRVLGACLRSEQWDKMLVAAGADGRLLLWKIMERMLSTFARHNGASSTRDAYKERRNRDPRLDSSLAIRLAAGTALARTLDGALPSLPRWAVWPLVEIDYENGAAHLYTFVPSRAAVEHILLLPAVSTGRRAATLRQPESDLSNYLDAVRQQLARTIAARNTVFADAIVNELSPAFRRDANRQRDLVSRMFYVGVRLTFDQAGEGEPTAKDLADLWLCWDLEPTETPKQVRQRWRDRVESGQRYFAKINSSRSSTSSRST